MSALVSIIVPVYNLEEYIPNCISSLVNQTYDNIEILCIDDGSSDLSGQVVKSLAQNDPRIVYIKKDNGGVSSARNLGLEKAKGDYIMFVDGDDCLHNQAVEILLDAVNKTDCDVAVANFGEINSYSFKFDKIDNYNNRDISIPDFFGNLSPNVSRSACGRLFKRDAALSSGFPVGVTNCEDFVFLTKVLNSFKKISYTDNVLYYYYNRPGSASKSVFKLSALTAISGLSDLCGFFKNTDSDFLMLQSLLMLYKTIFSNRTLCIGTKYENESLNKCKTVGNQWLKYLLKNPYADTKTKIIYYTFHKSRYLYELARVLTDPTMKEFYKDRKTKKSLSEG